MWFDFTLCWVVNAVSHGEGVKFLTKLVLCAVVLGISGSSSCIFKRRIKVEEVVRSFPWRESMSPSHGNAIVC